MNTFKIEQTKLFKRKSTKVLIYMYAIVMILLSGIYLYGEKALEINLLTSGQFIPYSLAVTMSFILPFICLYISSTSFALDFGKGTIKNMFLLPIKKVDIYVGKILAVQYLMGILLGIQFALTLLFSLFIDGGAGLSSIWIYILEYLGAFIILGMISLISVNISLLVTSTGLTILISYLLYTGMSIIGIYVPQINNISLSRIIGNYNEVLTSIDINLLLSVISYYIILFIVGRLIFEKKEESICQYE